MSPSLPPQPGAFPAPTPAPAPARRRSALIAGGCLAALWAALTGGDPGSWAIGGPAVAAGAALAWALPPVRPWRLAPVALLRFAGFFAVASVRGAVDVAWRALDPRLPLNPGFRRLRIGLGPGPARVLLANTVSLLPGTLSAELEGDRLTVHALDLGADVAAEVAAIETRIRALFGDTA